MRQPLRHVFLRLGLGLGLALAVVAPTVVSTDAHADARSEARTHYQSGVRFYNTGDYRAAIREFSAAQSLAPADLNNYNLALCYDKLGDAEPAIQYYRAYLDKVPSTDKRGEIEASISRLDAAAKSAAAKRAEEAKKAEEARKALEAKQAEEAKKAAEEEAARKKAEEEAKKATEGPVVGPMPPGTGGVGSTGTPSTGAVRPTGDAQLDRVQRLNIDQIRDERMGGASSGLPDHKTTPGRTTPQPGTGAAATGGPNGPDEPIAESHTNPNQPNQPNHSANTVPSGPADQATPTDKKPTPVYKKWWFWAVVAVSAYVVYSIATDGSKSSQGRLLPEGAPAPAGSGGMTLLRF